MLYGSEAWCLRERDGNFEENRKSYDSSYSYVRCEAIRSKKQRELMAMLSIKESLGRMAKASSMRW